MKTFEIKVFGYSRKIKAGQPMGWNFNHGAWYTFIGTYETESAVLKAIEDIQKLEIIFIDRYEFKEMK